MPAARQVRPNAAMARRRQGAAAGATARAAQGPQLHALFSKSPL